MILRRLYRLLFCRGGYGVHSPFVYDLITNVIEERYKYYSYESLRRLACQLKRSMGIKLQLKERENRLLLRLSNRFKPEEILVTEADYGIIPLYITVFSSQTRCLVVEQDARRAAIIKSTVKQYGSAKIEVLGYNTLSYGFFNMIVVNVSSLSVQLLDEARETAVLIITGMEGNSSKWRSMMTHKRITVSIDLGSMYIILFNSKLPCKRYKSALL